MLRPLTSLVTSWTAYRLLRLDDRLATMDEETVQKWASCIPVWTAKLATMHVALHRPWVHNLYRHGHRMTQDEGFWKTLQKTVTKSSNGDIDMAMTQAGLFGNPMPFVHFEPYEDVRKNILGETQIVTGAVEYMRATFKHGTHPDLGSKLAEHGLDDPSDFALFNLPVRDDETLFGLRENNTENYWRFFDGQADFPIGCLVDYYQTMLNYKPSDTALASWAHAAWNAKRTNMALQESDHWEVFERQVRPLFESRIDWELVAACQGFLLSPDNSRNREIASYAQNNLMFKVAPIERPQESDAVALGMLSLVEPKTPWALYTLFSDALAPESALESYPLDFS